MDHLEDTVYDKVIPESRWSFVYSFYGHTGFCMTAINLLRVYMPYGYLPTRPAKGRGRRCSRHRLEAGTAGRHKRATAGTVKDPEFIEH